MTRFSELVERRLLHPVREQCRQGITAQKLAATIAIGGALGVFPLLGVTTLLCLAAGVAFRLNQPLIQTTNYLVYPLQLPLMYAFVRTGEWLTGAPRQSFAVGELVPLFMHDPAAFLRRFGLTGLHGIAGWCLLAIPAGAIAYVLFLPLVRKLSGDQNRQPPVAVKPGVPGITMAGNRPC